MQAPPAPEGQRQALAPWTVRTSEGRGQLTGLVLPVGAACCRQRPLPSKDLRLTTCCSAATPRLWCGGRRKDSPASAPNWKRPNYYMYWKAR